MEYRNDSLMTSIYLWFYGESKIDLPSSFCVYARKWILLIPVIVPFTIFCLPNILFTKFVLKENDVVKPSDRIFYSCFLYIILFTLISLLLVLGVVISGHHLEKTSLLFDAFIYGCVIYFIIICGLVFHYGPLLKRKILGKLFNRTSDYSTRPNILVDYIKAKKEKICPTITWVSKKR